MNLIQLIDCCWADDRFSWNNFCFFVVKDLLYGKKYFLSIAVNVDFFSDLKFKYDCEYYPEILLQESLK